MTKEQWEWVKDVFSEALEHPPADREPFAQQAAKDHPELLPELLRLLKENERDSDLLSRPALANVRTLGQNEAPRLGPGSILARRFRIARFIARGGMGEVYEAEDVELGERVALKAIRQRVASDTELRALFKKEIQMARRVTHPNVCRIFDLAQHEDTVTGETALLLSMELIEGRTLGEQLLLNGPLAFRDALPWIEDIAAGLQAVHDAGIVHGDLKPGNVMLVARPGEPAPRAVVMDFGMALPMTQASQRGGAADAIPQSGSSPLRGGTPEYFAPEQTKGAPATAATDVYALALVICRMLGIPRAAPLKPEKGRMPFRWTRILRRCLADDPAHRLKRPADLAAALRASADGRSRRKWIAGIAACAALGILIAAARIEIARGPANRLLLTETSALTIRAASPDGKFLAGTSWDTGDLILNDVSSGKVRRLTNKKTSWQEQFGGVYGAVFSPNGRQVAYEWMNSRTDEEVRIVGIDGKGERRLYHNPEVSFSLADWSPDGSKLLVRLNGNPRQLAFISIPDGALQTLRNQPDLATGSAMFGEDSNTIIFDAKHPGNDALEIHRLSVNGGESTLVGRTGSNSIMGWSDDRRRLLFSSDRRGHPGLWAVAVSAAGAGAEPRELVQEARNWEPLGTTRSGSLFYRQDASSVDVYTAVLDLAAGRTVSPPQRVTERYVGSYAYPNWSEDGGQLVFDSNRQRPTSAVAIFEPQTGRLRELPLDLLYSWRPQWVEHGAAIMVYGKAPDGREGLFRVDPRTGAATLVRSHTDLESAGEGAWSRDGKIHFNRFQNFRRGIFRLNVETGERRVLYIPPAGVDVGTENLALSPDGRTLAFHARNSGTGSLMLIPAEGGEARALLTIRQPESFWYGSFTWTPDSQSILAARTRNLGRSPNDDMVSEIWKVPVDGSAPTRIDMAPLFVQCLRLNPDGKTIAFQVRHWRSEIWMLQNFL